MDNHWIGFYNSRESWRDHLGFMPHSRHVFEFLDSNITQIKEQLDRPQSFLYIGWRRDCSPWWYDRLCKELEVTRVGVMEIFPKNIIDLQNEVLAGRYDATVTAGDVREIDRYFSAGEWDVIFWDHGPEHVTLEDLKTTTEKLCNVAGKLVIYCCPWGDWPQGIEDMNEHEIHLSSMTDEYLTELGFRVFMFNSPGQDHEGELLGFKTTGSKTLQLDY